MTLRYYFHTAIVGASNEERSIMRHIKMLLLITVTLLFTACGGGSTSEGSSVPIVKFIDEQYGMYLYDRTIREYTYREDGNIQTIKVKYKRINDALWNMGGGNQRFLSNPMFNTTNERTYTYDFSKNEVTVGTGAYEGPMILKFDDTGKILSAESKIGETNYVYDNFNTIKSSTTTLSYNVDTSDGYLITGITTYNLYGKIEASTFHYEWGDNYVNNSLIPIFTSISSVYSYNQNNTVAIQDSTIEYKDGTTENLLYEYDSKKDGRVLSVHIDDSDEGIFKLRYQYYDTGELQEYFYREDSLSGTWLECIDTFGKDGNKTNNVCTNG